MNDQTHPQDATPSTGAAPDPSDYFDRMGGHEINADAGFWKPARPGDMLAGLFADLGETKHGPFARIMTADGNVIRLGLNAVLRDLLLPNLAGKYVAVQYTGDKPTGEGDMRLFRVKVIGKEQATELWHAIVQHNRTGD